MMTKEERAVLHKFIWNARLSRTELECEERQRQIDQQWQMLPVLFAQWKATIGTTIGESNETVASRVLFHRRRTSSG
jgi:hypothetical protein